MRTFPTTGGRARGGFTLLELVISLAILSVMVGAALMVQVTGYDAFEAANLQTEAEGKARRGLDRVAQELERAVVMNLFTNFTALAPHSESLTWLSASGLVDGALTPGSVTHVSWESDPRDPENGLDDDGDGLVDEGVVALWREVGEAGQIRVVVANDVTRYFAGEVPNGADDNGNGSIDEAGFHFELDGDLMTLRISVAARDSEGRTVLRTAETSIRMRSGT